MWGRAPPPVRRPRCIGPQHRLHDQCRQLTRNGVGYGKWMNIDGWSDSVIEYARALVGDGWVNGWAQGRSGFALCETVCEFCCAP
jgi:hypothetical protein